MDYIQAYNSVKNTIWDESSINYALAQCTSDIPFEIHDSVIRIQAIARMHFIDYLRSEQLSISEKLFDLTLRSISVGLFESISNTFLCALTFCSFVMFGVPAMLILNDDFAIDMIRRDCAGYFSQAVKGAIKSVPIAGIAALSVIDKIENALYPSDYPFLID